MELFGIVAGIAVAAAIMVILEVTAEDRRAWRQRSAESLKRETERAEAEFKAAFGPK